MYKYFADRFFSKLLRRTQFFCCKTLFNFFLFINLFPNVISIYLQKNNLSSEIELIRFQTIKSWNNSNKFSISMHSKTSKLYKSLDTLGFWQEGLGYKDIYGSKQQLVSFIVSSLS